MRRLKSNFFLIYTYEAFDKMDWPENAGAYCCMGNVSTMLTNQLGNSRIGSELKWIVSWSHRRQLMEEYNVTSEDIDNYVKARCSLLIFQAKGTRKRAIKILEGLGLTGFKCVDSYRDVLLQEAHYYLHKEFSAEPI